MAEQPRRGDVVVLVGTRKGAFLFWSDAGRAGWRHSAHHLGWMVDHITLDARTNTVFAATASDVFGGLVQRSRDFGGSWEQLNAGLEYPSGLEYPDGTGKQLTKVWHVEPGPEAMPGRLYAGVQPAGLFVSDDDGDQWARVSSLDEHETTSMWMPGGGGLVLHTILSDPSRPGRVYACVSAGGAYRSDDGGQTWAAKNEGVRADFLAETSPEAGQCVHKLAVHPAKPEVLYQQNHCGVYRSDDCGDHWVDIGAGLPSTFGFPMALHGHDPDTAYLVPLYGDDRRLTADGRLAVWRTRDRGDSWYPLTKGLPDEAYVSVLREGLATDRAEPSGVYVGTTTGQLYHSRDEGESWQLLADLLPPIHSVEAAIVS